MKTQTVLEGNKLIAEFMGAIFHKDWTSAIYKIPQDTYEYIINPTPVSSKFWMADEMCYHSSWDWLMPVVDKIEKENASQFTYRYYDEINWGKELHVVTSSYFLNSYNRLNKKFKCESSNKLEAYWLAVVEFIKWYNLNK